MARMGRPAIFSERKTDRFQGMMTKVGKKKFEDARRWLAGLAGVDPKHVSDADVAEALARGEADVRAYLAAKKLA